MVVGCNLEKCTLKKVKTTLWQSLKVVVMTRDFWKLFDALVKITPIEEIFKGIVKW